MSKKKLLAMLTGMVMAFMGLAGVGAASADTILGTSQPEKASLTVHKYLGATTNLKHDGTAIDAGELTGKTPLEGVIAETAGAFTLYLTEYLKIPVSTTHTITGAIIGVGATKRLSAVRWGITRSLMTAWVLTIPVSGILAAAIYGVVGLFLG